MQCASCNLVDACYAIFMRFTRISYLFFVAVLFTLSFGGAVSAQVANTFVTNLSVGSSGAEVVALQKILNESPDTQIATVGPGSPGNETSYFGFLTQAAVMRFQTKYASQVLTPAGLTQATGFVGSYTRALLNAFVAVGANASVATSVAVASPTASATTSQNPNFQNIDAYINAVNETGFTQGLSSSTLSFVDQKIRTEAATTTNFTQQFYNEQQALYEKQLSVNTSGSPMLAFFEKTLSLVAEPFYIEKAYAAIGVPFGGYLTYVNPAICDCPPGVITHLFVSLPNVIPPAVSNMLLDYTNGSEAFDYHNIPEPGIAVLGLYAPGTQACYTYVGESCVPVGAAGLIINPVGSSLAP